MAETLEQRLRRGAETLWERDRLHIAADMREAADALAALSIPKGWKLVPVALLPAQRKAMADAYVEWFHGGAPDSYLEDHMHAAMLAAAPPLPKSTTVEESKISPTENAEAG